MLFNEHEGSRREFLEILIGQGEEPAFLSRSRDVFESLAQLHDFLTTERDRLLENPRSSLRWLAVRLQHDWSRLACCLTDRGQVQFFEKLFDDWHLSLGEFEITSRGGWFDSDRKSLVKFQHCVTDFNQKWARVISEVEIDSVNRKLKDYNTYYPIEKICAFGSEDIQRLGFDTIPPITRPELERKYPFIVLPVLRAR